MENFPRSLKLLKVLKKPVKKKRGKKRLTGVITKPVKALKKVKILRRIQALRKKEFSKKRETRSPNKKTLKKKKKPLYKH